MCEISLDLSFPLDDERFLLRQCSSCRRKFSVYCPEDKESEKEDKHDDEKDEFLYCPYCGHKSTFQGFNTDEQDTYLESIAYNYCIGKFNDSIKNMKRSAEKTGFIKVSGGFDEKGVNNPSGIDVNIINKVVSKCCSSLIKLHANYEDAFFYCHKCGTRNIVKNCTAKDT